MTNKMKYKIGDKVKYSFLDEGKKGIVIGNSNSEYEGAYPYLVEDKNGNLERIAGSERQSPNFYIIKRIEDTTPDTPEDKHYRHGTIEPIDYIKANKLEFDEGNIIKYVTRYKFKNGLEDLKKAKFYLDRLIKEGQNENNT